MNHHQHNILCGIIFRKSRTGSEV